MNRKSELKGAVKGISVLLLVLLVVACAFGASTIITDTFVSTTNCTVTDTLTASTGRTATFTVAASDSSALSKAQADFVCDGIADNVEIQAAIDALPAGGGKVVLLEGTYYITSTINIDKPLYLEGCGGLGADGSPAFGGTLLTVVDNSNCNVIYVEDANMFYFVFLEHFQIDGNRASNTAGHGIYVRIHASDVLIRDVVIRDCEDDGIRMEPDHNGWIVDCWIEDCGGYGVYIGSQKCTVTGCCIGGNQYVANLQISSYDYTSVINNRIYANSYINTAAIGVLDSDHNRIEGNYLQNALWGLKLRNSDNNDIVGNLIAGSGEYGILVGGSSYNSIVGNVLHDNCKRGNPGDDYEIKVGVYNTEYSNNNIMSSNNILCEYMNKAKYGIGEAEIGHTNNYVTGNLITGASTSGVVLYDVTNKYSNKYSDLFMDVLAVSATHVRSNEDLSAATPITFTIDAQPDVPRTLGGHFDSHAQITAYSITITGVDAKGNTITENKTEANGWDWETSNAFAKITSIIMTSRTGTGAGDTMDIGITDVLGLSNKIYATSDVFKIKKNNADATVVAGDVSVTYGTYDMHTITLGADDDFTIWYKSNLNIIS